MTEIDWDALVLQPVAAIFGKTALYFPQRSDPYDVVGVFNGRYKETTIEDAQIIEDFKVIFGVRAALFSATPVQNDLLRVDDVLYVLTNIEPDGMGELKLSFRAATNDDAARIRF